MPFPVGEDSRQDQASPPPLRFKSEAAGPGVLESQPLGMVSTLVPVPRHKYEHNRKHSFGARIEK